MGHSPVNQPTRQPQKLPQCAIQLRACTGKVKTQYNQSQIRLLRLTDNQLVRLGRQLPVNLMQTVAGTVFTQIVDLRKSTAGLWVIRTVLKMTEVRQFGRLLRFRLDSDSASGRQVQR